MFQEMNIQHFWSDQSENNRFPLTHQPEENQVSFAHFSPRSLQREIQLKRNSTEDKHDPIKAKDGKGKVCLGSVHK